MKQTPVSPQRVRELSYHPLARAVSFALGVMMASAAAPAFAGPEDGQIVEGIGSITQGIDTTLITQGSQTLGIDWQSFNVAAGESVRFDQPTSAAVAINRILDQNPSQIFGAIDANGHVYLLNPNGVVFGATARVDVGSLVASSLNLTRAENGSLEFSADGPAGLVVNRGLIRAATGGSVTLLGGSVANEGLIVADLGKVNLGAGARASLDFDGDGLLFFEVDGDVLNNDSGAGAAVSNSGTIQADGGQVLLSARAAQGVFANVVNNDGLIRAARIDNSGGTVRLVGSGAPVVQAGTIDVSAGDLTSTGGSIDVLGGDVNVTASANLRADGATSGGTIRVLADQTAQVYGDFSARGGAAGGNGGFIETSGDNVEIGGSFSANASAVNGARGMWLLDPTDIVIDGTLAGTTTTTLETGTDVTITTAGGGGDAGNITMTAPITKSIGGAATLNLVANNDISVTQDITSTAGNLSVSLAAGRNITVDANIGIPGGTLTATVDTNDNEVATLTIGTAGILSAATISLNGSTAQNDTLQVLRAGVNTATWTINGANSGTVSAPSLAVSSFQSFANLTGGDQTDNFTFAGAGVIGGTAAGAAGDDLFTVDNGTGAAAFNGGAGASDDLTYAGSAGPVTLSSGAVAGIETVTGSADGEDVLEGTSGADTFTTSADDEIAVGGVTFASFENLAGLGGNDIFSLGHNITGTTGVDGGANNDTFNLTADITTVIAGGADSDTIVADSGQATQFAISAGNGGSITNGTGGIAFGGVENLTGSGSADTFTFTAAGAITGTAAGLAGNDDFVVNNGNGAAAGTFDGGADVGPGDELTFAGSAGPVTLSSGAVANIETVTGSPNGEDTLQGTAGADTFTTTATDEISVGGLTFTSFENVAGLGGNDVFNLDNDLTGATGADGGANDDTFNLDSGTNTTIVGGANTDRIVADAGQATNFEISSPGTGNVDFGAVGFSGIESLTGSNLGDTFTFSGTGSLTGTILGLDGNDQVLTNGFVPDFDGGNGTDTLNFGPSGAGTPRIIDVNADPGFDNVVGSPNAQDVLEGTGLDDIFLTTAPDQVQVNARTFSSFENLRGLGGNDTFNLNHNITGTEGVNGGAGDDAFNVAVGVTATIAGGLDLDRIVAVGANARQFAITSVNGGTVANAGGTLTFGGVENLTGNIGGDTFTFTGAGALGGTAAGSDGDDDFNVNNDNGTAAAFDGGNGASDDLSFALSGGPVTVAVSGLTGIETVTGTASSDTLQGTSGNDTFATSAANNGSVAGVNFIGFENLQGGTGDDTFTLTHNVTSADGGADNDTFNLATGVSATIAGSSGTDRIVAAATQATQFTIGSANGGSVTNGVGALTFTGVENLTGSNVGDAFTFNGAGSLGGTAAGGNGDDDFFVNNGNTAAATFDGGLGSSDDLSFAGSAGPVTVAIGAGFTGIETVTGTASSDTLRGTSGNDAFSTSSANNGSVNGSVNFIGFENLQGLAGDDTFNLDHNVTSADGGDDNDIFNFATGVTANVTGGTGTDSQRYTSAAGPLTIDVGSLTANSIEDIRGSTASVQDTLQGTGGADTFATTGANQGTVNNGTPSAITFSSFENLQGAGGDDVFDIDHDITGAAGVDGGANNDIVNLGAGVTAVVTGGADTDSLRYATQTGPVTIAVDNITAAQFEDVVGSTSGADILQGTAGADTFATNGANSGSVAGVTFSSFENLQGAAGADTFDLNHDVSSADGGSEDDVFNLATGVTANVIGGAGADSQRYTAATGPVTIAVGTLTTNSIEDIRGSSSGQDVLQGTASGDTFTTSGADAGSIGSVTFSSFENLEGLAGNDTFNLGHNITGTAGVNGGADADTFNLTATGATTLRGGAGADRFVFNDAVVANGVLDGGSEADVLDLRNYTTSRTITITGPGAIDGLNGTDASVPGGFQNIDDVQGSTTAADTLRGAGTSATWTLAGNSGVYATGGRSLAFTSFSTLEGGVAADAFSLGAGTFTGNLVIADGGGSDTANVTGAINVTGNLTLTNIETVTDTSGARVTAGTLRITGATGGVGATNQALQTNVNNLEITGGNNIVVTEQNGLTVSTVDAGTGTVRVTVSTNDLVLGFVRGGNVRLDALDGDILATTGGTHLQGNPVALVTPFGTSGTEANPIVINTPTTGQILIESLDPATISNLNLATVLATRSSVIDVTVNQGIDLGTLGSSISRQEVATIDWAGLDPNIALVDCLQPCIMLPADQSEEPGLVNLREATKLLLIRTRDGWKLIPVMVREEVVAAR